MRIFRWLPLLVLPWLVGCGQPPLLDRLHKLGHLSIGTVAGPLTCYLDVEGPAGLEYELARRFAHHLGLAARFRVYPTRRAALRALARGEVQLVAAARQPTREDRRRFRLSRPWGRAPLVFVNAMGQKHPKALEVPAGSLAAETLAALDPPFAVVLADRSAEAILETIGLERRGHTLADQALVNALAARLPYLMRGGRLDPPQPLVWYFARGFDTSLVEAADRFLSRQDRRGRLTALWKKYVTDLPRRDYVTRRDFWTAVKTRLPRYLPLFRQAARDTGIDWRLLAAVGYQESHWQPDAVSPTGVRGLMMLTREAARRQGVSDRTDPAQSIRGGARHLRWMEERIPARIPEPDRLWLTLAAYNVGYGHLEDARVLTQRQGGDPDRWAEVKERLPLLADPQVYATLKHGRARGGEPVAYVENIRFYYRLLVWWDHRRRGRDCTADGYRRRALKN